MLISLSLDSLIGIFVVFCLQRRKVVSTPLEWGQAWLERALLVKAPVLLSEGKLELGEHSLELLYCCHRRQAASNVLTHLYQPVTGRRPASPLLPFRNCYFRPRRLWPRLLPPFFCLVENAKQRRHFSSTKPSFTSTYFYLHIRVSHFYTFFELSLVLLTTQAHGL